MKNLSKRKIHLLAAYLLADEFIKQLLPLIEKALEEDSDDKVAWLVQTFEKFADKRDAAMDELVSITA